MVTIHRSGKGAEALQVVSYHNGGAYAFNFGEHGSPSRTLFFQGDEASVIREEFEAAETAMPCELTRDVWLRVLAPYL